MVVQHNLTAINANRYFGMNNNKLSKSLEKLSSGYAINRAGDNAAGLAVSEKMRAQIGGITQAVKNAQDGISMVQTFEGALTETDNILQRMRTLAVQSANGSYDDSVDRAAIQLEYDQLNDELDQIADTDFNGVVVLNGGKMADGLEQVDGKFDYANAGQQTIDAAAVAYAEAEAAAKDTLKAAQDTFNSTPYDLSANGGAQEWNTVDETVYDKDMADALWTAAEIFKTDADGNPTSEVDISEVTELSVTFTFDGSKWAVENATDAVGNDGNTYDLTALTTTPTTIDPAKDTSTGYGGFVIGVALNGVNAIFDATAAKDGDTVTLNFTNAPDPTKAPTNIGWVDDSATVSDDATNIAATDFTIEIAGGAGTAVTDDLMNADLNAAFDGLEGLEVVATYTDGGNSAAVTLDGKDISTNGASVTIGEQTYTIATGTDKITIQDSTGTYDLATISLAAPVTSGDKTVGTFSATIAKDFNSYGDTSAIDCSAGKNSALGTSNDAKAVLDAAQAEYDALVAMKPTDLDSAVAFMNKDGVSVSDSNQASTAVLTYKDNMTLQVGARTKDSVNFTFAYESDGLGDLEADLNCTAAGLGTAELSLAKQEDANTAIDKIDNAINKISMVRGTFGAIQNRLEHKIDNLNVTNENLTAAESRIRDTDMASEMMNFTKQQILSQASQSMLAQANQLPQGVLSLLQ